jgi:hypothetical protein
MDNLQSCKRCALAHVETGDLIGAVVAMADAIQKCEDTKFFNEALFRRLVASGLEYANNGDELSVRKWIQGFA